MNMMTVPGFLENVDWTVVLICVGIGLLIGLITVLVMRAQLKSVRPQNAAMSYVIPGSFHLRHSRDIFLYRNVTRTARPKNNNR